MKWYRISRKTPAEWHAEVDADSNGVLSTEEFVTFLGTTAHLDTRVRQADKDKSGGISVEELAGFIASILEE
jgi:Ca2+-binding EF-hand superfamily protein